MDKPEQVQVSAWSCHAYTPRTPGLQGAPANVTCQKYLETKAIQERLKQTSVGISVVRQSVLLDTSLQTEKNNRMKKKTRIKKKPAARSEADVSLFLLFALNPRHRHLVKVQKSYTRDFKLETGIILYPDVL